MAVNNILSGRHKTLRGQNLFNPAVILSLIFIGFMSFAALIVLSGYAGDLRKDYSGNSTAKSNSAIGFAGYVQLLKSMDYQLRIGEKIPQKKKRWQTAPLRIYTLTHVNQSEGLKAIPQDTARLIILPKWNTVPNAKKPGWVHKSKRRDILNDHRLTSLLRNADIDLEIAQIASYDSADPYTLKFGALKSNDLEDESKAQSTNDFEKFNYDTHSIESAIEQLQYFDMSEALKTAEIILTADAQPVLIKLADLKTYILSEPDLLNTHGIATRQRARLAVSILDIIADYEGLTPKAADFDLSIHDGASNLNIIKIMTQPPFLAATLCLLAAGGIIAWQAFSRFGDPISRLPDFAQGPVSLAKSAAQFMRTSNRVQHMAPDYAQLTRQQVIRKLGLIGLSQDQIDHAIKAREIQRKISPNFAALTALTRPNTDIDSPQDRPNLKSLDLTEYARAMTRWKEEMTS